MVSRHIVLMDVLEKIGVGPFRPFLFMSHPHAQTIAGAYLPQAGDILPTAVHEFLLPDKDKLIVVENRPPTFTPGDRIAVLVHGLLGSHASGYMIRIARQLVSSGFLVYRLNLRNCGPGFGHAFKPYHAGMSEDTREFLKWLKVQHPLSPVTQIGFSLGGNLTLKMASEDNSRPSGNLDSIVAVCPPLDLESSALRMNLGMNRVFSSYFIYCLKRDVQRLHTLIDRPIPSRKVFNVRGIHEFDEVYTAPVHGFSSGKDYYQQCSSGHLIGDIRIPTLVLASHDDPIADSSLIRQWPKRDGLDVVVTDTGGHVGFVGFDKWYDGPRWMDRVVVNWICHLQTSFQGHRYSNRMATPTISP